MRFRVTIPRLKKTLAAWWRHRWLRRTAAALGVLAVLLLVLSGYFYVRFARVIDAQLHGERTRVRPRIFARALELRTGQAMSSRQLIDRLNDLGYTERPEVEKAGEFSVTPAAITIAARGDAFKGQVVRVVYQRPVPPSRSRRPAPPPRVSDRVEVLEVGTKPTRRVTLDTPLLSSIMSDRSKLRPVALSSIQPRVIEAVLAIEDRRYYYHPGVDPIRLAGAVRDKIFGRRDRIEATSTITQQLVRNVFLPQFEGWTLASARSRLPTRKALEIWISLVMSQRATKDEVLEMYLNALPLGQRGSFAIVGVSEAARLMFGKDISNVTLAEAATIAGLIQSPSALSPFNNPGRARERRNVVLRAMAAAAFITPEEAAATIKQPLTIVQRALEAEAPYFVDYVSQTLAEQYPGLTTTTDEPVDVYTTLDSHLQKLAQDAVRDGLTRVDQQLARRRRRGRAEAALIAVDPRNGEILAMVGGRSYNQSQFNRVVLARRQPGSVFKPFVYLAAFQDTSGEGSPMTPATIVDDSPTSWEVDGEIWSPTNYGDEYDGPVTLRRALARSRNIATIKVAERAGYDKVAALWRQLGVGMTPRAYPSIALGVFETSPIEIATAYTLFPNAGVMRALQHVTRIERGGDEVTAPRKTPTRDVAKPDATYLVTSMMRSVINEGTGAGVRGGGFTLDAAGKTGTTNDLRDAWFVGFTPELLTVVWVGFDDNQVLGLSGAQAAVPIWTQFMKGALSGRANVSFEVPEGVQFAEIDPTTGNLAAAACPTVVNEAFLSGALPGDVCSIHLPQSVPVDTLPEDKRSPR